jgi:hypothetical protein
LSSFSLHSGGWFPKLAGGDGFGIGRHSHCQLLAAPFGRFQIFSVSALQKYAGLINILYHTGSASSFEVPFSWFISVRQTHFKEYGAEDPNFSGNRHYNFFKF